METNEDGTTYFHRGTYKKYPEGISSCYSGCANLAKEFTLFDEDVDIPRLTIMIIIYAVI